MAAFFIVVTQDFLGILRAAPFRPLQPGFFRIHNNQNHTAFHGFLLERFQILSTRNSAPNFQAAGVSPELPAKSGTTTVFFPARQNLQNPFWNARRSDC